MKVGERTDISGYEEVARFPVFEGTKEYVVVHNNSTHFLIFQRHTDVDDDPNIGHFVESMQYDENVYPAFRAAMRRALQLAIEY